MVGLGLGARLQTAHALRTAVRTVWAHSGTDAKVVRGVQHAGPTHSTRAAAICSVLCLQNCFACARSVTTAWCALARERARVATPEKAAAASQRLVEPLKTRRPREKGKAAAELTAALPVLEATPSLSLCAARTAGILLQRRHVRHLPWMRETSKR